MSQMSLVRAERAEENRAYVRKLLWQRQPAFAAALAAAERYFSCFACPCRTGQPADAVESRLRPFGTIVRGAGVPGRPREVCVSCYATNAGRRPEA
jgi:hypothetical protein